MSTDRWIPLTRRRRSSLDGSTGLSTHNVQRDAYAGQMDDHMMEEIHEEEEKELNNDFYLPRDS